MAAGFSVEGKGAGGCDCVNRFSITSSFQPVLSLPLLGFQDLKPLWVLEGESS